MKNIDFKEFEKLGALGGWLAVIMVTVLTILVVGLLSKNVEVAVVSAVPAFFIALCVFIIRAG